NRIRFVDILCLIQCLLRGRYERGQRRENGRSRSVKFSDTRGELDTLQLPPPENTCVLGGS
ncbi:MAG: hypothetical protein IKF65_01180, partial [Clostridia bacterium]|nr:hypothetical protein [Clostridia bacterium]